MVTEGIGVRIEGKGRDSSCQCKKNAARGSVNGGVDTWEGTQQGASGRAEWVGVWEKGL